MDTLTDDEHLFYGHPRSRVILEHLKVGECVFIYGEGIATAIAKIVGISVTIEGTGMWTKKRDWFTKKHMQICLVRRLK